MVVGVAAAMVEVEAMAEVAIMVEVVEETMEATCRVFICLSVLCSLHIQNFRTGGGGSYGGSGGGGGSYGGGSSSYSGLVSQIFL